MKLPDGIQQDTACVLIAFREYFNDPNWVDEALVENIKNNKDKSGTGGSLGWRGNLSDFDALCQKHGLWCPPAYFPTQNSNSDYLVAHLDGKRYRWRRSMKAIIVLRISATVTHCMCLPVGTVNSFLGNKVWALALPRQGCIVDEIS